MSDVHSGASTTKNGPGSVRVVFAAICAVLTITFLFDGNAEGNELDSSRS